MIRHRRTVRVIGAAALLGLGVSTLGYGAYAALAPVPAAQPALQALPALSTPEPEVSIPGYGAAAFGAADGRQVYASRGLDEVRPIASITKVVTALVVLDARPIEAGTDGATITLTAADTALVDRYRALDGTTAPAPVGTTVSQRDIIELMMVASANNYAETLATWAFGSVAEYLTAARVWLDEHDLASVSVGDSTGFSLLNRASPRALLDLGRLALADPVVSAAAAMPEVTVPGVGSYENRNLIVGVDGVTGLKTGTLIEAGACLLFSAREVIEGREVDVVGVVLGGPDHPTVADDVRALLASARDDFHEITLATTGQLVARYETEWGATASLHVSDTLDDLVWGEVRAIAAVRAPALQPGGPLPDPGSITVRYGDRRVSIPLEWRGALEAPGLAWRLAQPLEEALGR
ncbi:MAG: D-alanyl-D-alanine carboxypeptidase [Microcella sp.]|uniref:D-alanyl-D-alanine carboxypeptidase family protein n=1 Tax=Microcella sp. TaxID=1913979 RepID=UPI003314A357